MYSCNITLQLHLHTNITTGSVTQLLNLNQNIRSSYFISSKASFFFFKILIYKSSADLSG